MTHNQQRTEIYKGFLQISNKNRKVGKGYQEDIQREGTRTATEHQMTWPASNHNCEQNNGLIRRLTKKKGKPLR